VERGRPDLYWQLRRRFAGRAHVRFDRRKGEQRQTVLPVARERRRGSDRRLPLSIPEDRMWNEFGYRLVYKAEGFEIRALPD